MIMDIVLCTDRNYIMPTCVMIKSVCINNKETAICFHVVVDRNVADSDKGHIEKVISEEKNKRIIYYDVNHPELDDLPLPRKDKYTKVVYFRIVLDRILPPDIHKVLFMDCDIIVRHSLEELWNEDISKVALGAVPDMGDANMEYYNRLQYSSSDGYFNGGVLLLNLDYWREHQISASLFEYLQQYPERIALNDQDVMNAVLKDKKKRLHLKWNVQHGFLLVANSNFEWLRYGSQFAEAIKDPGVIHFSADLKPWMKGDESPYSTEWFKYQAMTGWSGKPLLEKRSLRRRFTTLIRKILSSPKESFMTWNPD